MQTRVEVTQADIDAAVTSRFTKDGERRPDYNVLSDCPVARALRRVVKKGHSPTWAYVSGSIYGDDDYTEIGFIEASNFDRDEVRRFVMDFDDRKKVSPISFTADVQEVNY